MSGEHPAVTNDFSYWQGSGSSDPVSKWKFGRKSMIAGTRRWVCSRPVVLETFVHHLPRCCILDIEGFQISLDSLFNQVRREFRAGFVNSLGCVRLVSFICLFFVCGHSNAGFQILRVATSSGFTLKKKNSYNQRKS